MHCNKISVLLLALVLLLSCHDKNIKYLSPKVDTLVKDCLDQHKDLTFDTSNNYYRLLRALYKNDTAYIRHENEELQWQKEAREIGYPYDSCIKQYRKIDSLGYDEVYKFNYDKANDCLRFIALLGAKDTQYSLHYLVYREANQKHGNYDNHKANFSYGVNPQTCKIFKEATILLSEKEYYFLRNKILFVDFWNLKPIEKDAGWLHPDRIIIEGYTRPYQKQNNGQFHFVMREAVDRLALKLPFEEVLKKIGTNFENLDLFLYPKRYGDTNYYHYY